MKSELESIGDLPAVIRPPLDTDVTLPRILKVESPHTGSGGYLLGLDHFNKCTSPNWPILLTAYRDFNTTLPECSRVEAITEGGIYDTLDLRPPTVYVPSIQGGIVRTGIFNINNAAEVLRAHGEQASLRYLAMLQGDSAETAETPACYEVAQMVKRFDLMSAAYFYYMRYARQYMEAIGAGEQMPDYDTYVESRASHNERIDLRLVDERTGLRLVDVSKRNLQATHEILYPGTPFDPAEPLNDGSYRTSEYYKLLYFPFGQGKKEDDLTLIQQMALYCNEIRDQYHAFMVKIFLKESDTRFFDLHGSIHNLVLEDVLRKTPGVEVKSYTGWLACSQLLELPLPEFISSAN